MTAIGFVRRSVWLHPEWWALSLAAAAWSVILLRPHHTSTPPFGEWALMLAAMMIPLVVIPVRIAAERSLWRRRHRAIAGFLVGYLGMWMAFGAAALSLLRTAGAAAWPGTTMTAFAIAALWQLTGVKRRALLRCHRGAPLAPAGWRADRDAIGYGVRIARTCGLACGPVMLALIAAGHRPLLLLGVSLVLCTERYVERADPRTTALALLTLGLATGPL
jgi:predicted metal-binding membrane protein